MRIRIRACVCGWDGVKGKTPPFDSLTTQCGQQKYWVLVAGLHFFFFFLSVEVFFFEAGKAKWEPLTCTFSSREEIRMIDVIFQETASEKNTWSENVTYYPFFFVFLRCELVLKIAHIHFDFRVKHCELWQNGGRKCWGQILACCRKKKIYNPASWGLSSAPDSLSDLHILYCSRSTLAEPLYLPPP